jgi:peptidoglycan/xylan/chitin deacetylase (PgdA/CDA1 family)/SAM-dependent methyltransferase
MIALGSGSNPSAVAVVIHDQASAQELWATIESLCRQDRRPSEIAVAVTELNDGLSRTIRARLDECRIACLIQAAGGSATTRNSGVGATTAPYLLSLACGSVLDPDGIAYLAGHLDRVPQCQLIVPAVRSPSDGRVLVVPPWTFAEALARAVGHPALMFRRAAWVTLGGFDAACEPVEELDFRLAALVRGFHGECVARPLGWAPPRYRVSVSMTSLAILHAKHDEAVRAACPDLLAAKEVVLQDARERVRVLAARRRALQELRVTLHAEIEGLAGLLAKHGTKRLDWGDLERLTPLSTFWGVERGQPIDRYFIEGYLTRYAADIRGEVLEVKDDGYASRFGGSAVTRCEVVDVDPANARATSVVDLAKADALPSDRYDCVILTQTLHVICDVRAVLAHVERILKPGGVLLCSFPAVSRVNPEDGGLDGGDFWRFTEASVRALLTERFPVSAFEVATFGNLAVATAFLQGMAVEEMSAPILDQIDPWHPLLYCARAVKAAAGVVDRPGGSWVRGRSERSAVVLVYHQVREEDEARVTGATLARELRRHLAQVRRLSKPWPLAELVRAARRGTLPDRAVAVTFDDGYLSALSVASPILTELEIPATFFVSTDRLAESHEPWWDTLTRIFQGRDPVPPELVVVVGDHQVCLATATGPERLVAHGRLHRLLMGMRLEDRVTTMRSIAQWSGQPLAPRDSHRVMTGAELLELDRRPGHTIGAHTVHHLSLPGLPPDVRLRELTECKGSLEALLGHPVRSLAYPFGAWSSETCDAVRQAGFELAVTVERDLLMADVDPLRVPRVEMSAGDDLVTILAGVRVVAARRR